MHYRALEFVNPVPFSHAAHNMSLAVLHTVVELKAIKLMNDLEYH